MFNDRSGKCIGGLRVQVRVLEGTPSTAGHTALSTAMHTALSTAMYTALSTAVHCSAPSTGPAGHPSPPPPQHVVLPEENAVAGRRVVYTFTKSAAGAALPATTGPPPHPFPCSFPHPRMPREQSEWPRHSWVPVGHLRHNVPCGRDAGCRVAVTQ